MKNRSDSNTVVASISKAKKEHTPETRGGSSFLKKRLFTLKEAADYLGRSEWGVRELIWGGKIPVVRTGRKVLYAHADGINNGEPYHSHIKEDLPVTSCYQ